MKDNEQIVLLNQKEKEAGYFLDSLQKNEKIKINILPSELLRGVKFLVLPANRSQNPDWMAQAAHSMRDIFYTLDNPKKQDKVDVIKEFSELRLPETEAEIVAKLLIDLNKIFNHIAHHFSTDPTKKDTENRLRKLGILKTGDFFDDFDFEDLFGKAIEILCDYHKNSIHEHARIDELIKIGTTEDVREQVSVLIESSIDTKKYFFASVPPSWAVWLHGKDFFNIVKEDKEDKTTYILNIPELQYLERVSSEEQDVVAQVILETPISPEHYHPGVIAQYLRITSNLAGENLQKVVKKQINENWLEIMGDFNQWGFDYKDILMKLAEEELYEELLNFAQYASQIKPDQKGHRRYFYFDKLSDLSLFEILDGLKSEYGEEVARLYLDVLKTVIKTVDKAEEGPFGYQDSHLLWDLNLFDLQKDESGFDEDIKSLLKGGVDRINGLLDSGESKENIMELVDLLPSSSTKYKMRLYVMTRKKEWFSDEIHGAMFDIFDTDQSKNHWAYLAGAEYEETLRIVLSEFSEDDKQNYVDQVLGMFGGEEKEEGSRKMGARLLSVVKKDLSTEQVEVSEKILGFSLVDDYEPRPSVSQHNGSFVRDRSPIEVGSFDIPELVEEFKTTCDPDDYKEKHKDRGYGAETSLSGIREEVQIDIKKRLPEYLRNSDLFFEPGVLHSHYTYMLIWGVRELVRNDELPQDIDLTNLFTLCEKVLSEGSGLQDNSYGSFENIGWIATWSAVRKAIAELAFESLNKADEIGLDFESNRDILFKIISGLFDYDEIQDSSLERDLFSDAINSMSGVAYQAYVVFLYKDYLLSANDEASRIINNDLKELFTDILSKKEDLPLMFIIGHYLASIYFRDKEWVRGLLEDIFNSSEENKYIAVTEGYLAGNLYTEMLDDMLGIYLDWLEKDPTNYPERDHSRDINKGLVMHVLLAYLYRDDYSFDSELFKKLWESDDKRRREKAVRFMCKHGLNMESDSPEEVERKGKVVAFWKWTLSQEWHKEAYGEYGLMLDKDRQIIEETELLDVFAQTVEKSEGIIFWDHGLYSRLNEFAKIDPIKTLRILDLHIHAELDSIEQEIKYFYLRDEIKNAFQVLYDTEQTKEDTKDLINRLLPQANGDFWPLKDVISE